MKTIQFIFVLAAFITSILLACTNPSERVEKGNSKMDLEDTTKTKDSVQAPARVNPEDTVRKY